MIQFVPIQWRYIGDVIAKTTVPVGVVRLGDEDVTVYVPWRPIKWRDRFIQPAPNEAPTHKSGEQVARLEIKRKIRRTRR